MNLCMPVVANEGLNSTLSAHFGSAPAFLIVDTDDASCRAIVNENDHHAHGQCTPLAALQGERIDGLVVAGIGRGALGKLEAASIRVYLSKPTTAGEALAAFKAGALQPMSAGQACAGHGH